MHENDFKTPPNPHKSKYVCCFLYERIYLFILMWNFCLIFVARPQEVPEDFVVVSGDENTTCPTLEDNKKKKEFWFIKVPDNVRIHYL